MTPRLIRLGTVRLVIDDSPFLSMADFFSLISLTLIYAMMVLAPQTPIARDAIEATNGRVARTNEQIAINAQQAFIAVNAEGDGFRIAIRWDKQQIDESIFISGVQRDIDAAASWIQRTVDRDVRPDALVFYIRTNETQPRVHLLLNQLEQHVARQYSVMTVFVDPDENGDH